MRWIEIIQVRTVGESALDALVGALGRTLAGDGVEATICRHATVATDLAIHVAYETDGDAAPDRALGERLAASLADHGLVSTSLWVEVLSSGSAARERRSS